MPPRQTFFCIWVILVWFFSGGVLPSSSMAQNKPAAKSLSVKRGAPDETQERQLVLQVRGQFSAEYQQARASAEKRDLAAKLVTAAARQGVPSANRFAMLREAQRLFTDAADVRGALDVTRDLTANFAIDAPAEYAQLFETLVPELERMEDRQRVSLAARDALRLALTNDDLDSANRVLMAIARVARQVEDVDVLQAAHDLQNSLRASSELLESELSRQKVSEQDTRQQAHDHRGRYLIEFQQDWAAGLRHLIKGSDNALAALARRDLARPKASTEQRQLASDWREQAEKEDNSLSPAACHAAAAYWLSAAIKSASDKKVQEQLRGELEALPVVLSREDAHKDYLLHPEGLPADSAKAEIRIVRVTITPSTMPPNAAIANKPSVLRPSLTPSVPKSAPTSPPPATRQPAPQSGIPFNFTAEALKRNREAAEWVYAQKGQVTVRTAEVPQVSIQPPGEIPATPFVIRDIHLKHNFADDDLKMLQALTELESFLASHRPEGAMATSTGLKHLTQSSKLRSLTIYNLRVDAGGIDFIAAFPELETLYLGPLESGIPNLSKLSKLPKLRVLSVSQGFGDAQLEQLGPCPELRVFYLGGSQVTNSGLKALRQFPRLEELVFSPQIGDEGVRHLTTLPLSSLMLNMSQVTDEGLKSVGQIRGVKSLGLFGTNITGSGLKELRELRGLSTLNLNRSKIRDEHCSAFRELTSLTSLDLRDTMISDSGVKELVELRQLTTLTLANTKITDAALPAIASLQKLYNLNLAGTAVTDAAVDNLAKLSSLRSLVLTKTKLTAAGAKQLKQHLPNCQIVSDFGL